MNTGKITAPKLGNTSLLCEADVCQSAKPRGRASNATSLGAKTCLAHNYFLFFYALHIPLQTCSTTKRKRPHAQAEQQCRFQMCLCRSGHIARPRRGYIRASAGNTTNTTRCETAQFPIKKIHLRALHFQCIFISNTLHRKAQHLICFNFPRLNL